LKKWARQALFKLEKTSDCGGFLGLVERPVAAAINDSMSVDWG
jgi:hypothetical protein